MLDLMSIETQMSPPIRAVARDNIGGRVHAVQPKRSRGRGSRLLLILANQDARARALIAGGAGGVQHSRSSELVAS